MSGAGELDVWLGVARVGLLKRADGGGLTFRYDRDWLEHPRRVPLSTSLPLGADPFVRGAASAYFENLLPCPPIRERIAEKLAIAPDDDFALLAALGGECAGAVSLQPRGADWSRLRWDYAPLSDRDLAAMTAPGPLLPLLTGRTRATLSGAQHKLPVLLRDGKLFLPVGPAPTSHILKLGDAEASHLPANEAFTTAFARELGLEVPTTELLSTEGASALLCQRFDRTVDDDGHLRRIHQEDFVQALGPRWADAVPTLEDAIGIVREQSRIPLRDTLRLLEWMVFHLIAGDSGAGPKNLALLYDDGATPRLAPFYDLVCTRAYRKPDRLLAMAVGGERDPVRIGREHWAAFARDLAIKEKTVIDLVAKTLDGARPALERAEARFRELYSDHEILRIVPVMSSQIDWVRQKLTP